MTYTPALKECTEAARRIAAAMHEIVAAARDVAGACGRGMTAPEGERIAHLTLDFLQDELRAYVDGDEWPAAEATGLLAMQIYGIALDDKERTDLDRAEDAIIRMEREQLGSAA